MCFQNFVVSKKIHPLKKIIIITVKKYFYCLYIVAEIIRNDIFRIVRRQTDNSLEPLLHIVNC